MIQFVGRDAYKQFWNFSKDEKENLATQLAKLLRLLVFHDKLIVPTKIGHAQFHGVYI